MTKRTVIALDAMGGDEAPDIVIEGAALARERYPNVSYLFYGDEEKIKPLLARHTSLQGISEIRHAPDAITAEQKPSIALRQGRMSSMRLAINAVAQGEAARVDLGSV